MTLLVIWLTPLPSMLMKIINISHDCLVCMPGIHCVQFMAVLGYMRMYISQGEMGMIVKLVRSVGLRLTRAREWKVTENLETLVSELDRKGRMK